VPTDPSVDPQFNLWEAAIADWAKRNNQLMSSSTPIDLTATSTASSTASSTLEFFPQDLIPSNATTTVSTTTSN
jgi:hypothetical protein